MDSIQRSLKRRLAQQDIAHLSIGAFLVHQCKLRSKYPKDLTGFIRNNTLTVKLDPKEDRMRWFMTREDLRTWLNGKLKKFEYEYEVKEVRIK